MKRICLYLLLLCLSASRLKAQEGVIFKIKYTPQHTYQSNTNLNMNLVLTLSGNQQLLDKLSSQGIKQPVNANVAISLNGNITSGALGADNTFPLNMDYKIGDISLKANGKEFPIPMNKNKDMKMYAHVDKDGVLKIDSAEGKKVNDSTEKKMQQMMSMMQRQIKFPDHALKVGESFNQAMPVNIPMKQMGDAKIDVNVTYTLVSIADGKANFDIKQSIALNFQMKKGTVSVTGAGTGKMVYSIKDNFPLSFNSALTMKIDATVGTSVVNGTATINTDQVTTIN